MASNTLHITSSTKQPKSFKNVASHPPKITHVSSPDSRTEKKLYLGLYVDDFIYFSESRDTERAFEKTKNFTNVDFMGDVTHFLGIKFSWTREEKKHITAHLNQEAFADHLIDSTSMINATTVETPYRSGHPVDSIPLA